MLEKVAPKLLYIRLCGRTQDFDKARYVATRLRLLVGQSVTSKNDISRIVLDGPNGDFLRFDEAVQLLGEPYRADLERFYR